MEPRKLLSWITLGCLCLTFGLTPQPAQATVHFIQVGETFTPLGTVVAPGDTVRWTLISGTHTVTAAVGSPKFWDSGTMDTPGQTFDVVFHYADSIGPFPYHCGLHSAVVDTIFLADTCWATGSLNDSLPLTVADYVYLMRVILGMDSTHDALYRFDLNGDCVVDESDAEIYSLWFIEGPGCCPFLPIATCCFPELQIASCPILLTGDLNEDAVINAADLMRMVRNVFIVPPPVCEQATSDVDCSGVLNASDLIFFVNYLFKSGPPPCDVCQLISEGVWVCP